MTIWRSGNSTGYKPVIVGSNPAVVTMIPCISRNPIGMVEVCPELCFDKVNIVPADLHAECADFLSKYSFFIQDRYNPMFQSGCT